MQRELGVAVLESGCRERYGLPCWNQCEERERGIASGVRDKRELVVAMLESG